MKMGLVADRVSASLVPPLPSPLDSGLRRNDEVGGRNDDACRSNGCRLFSYQSLMPAAAGTPRYENCGVSGERGA